MPAFHEWLTEVAATDLTVDLGRGGLNHEAHSNQWGFSFTQEQVQNLSPEDVNAFLSEVINIYDHRLRQANASGCMAFYCWFDAQASELRFSLVSEAHGGVPFAHPIETVNSLVEIVELLLGASHHDGIPLDEFVDNNPVEPEMYGVPLNVWTKKLPDNSLRPFGLAKGEFVVPDDFDDPLPEEVLRDFEGRGCE